jgi:single-stranded DNA-specific DHH superfamily exonuclease
MEDNCKVNEYDPILLKNINNALNRIITAINERQKIVIYGYYDFDGVAAISLLMLVLRYLNADVEYFIPSEVRDTRRLCKNDINNHIKYLGADLIITVGCGTSSLEDIRFCRENNIDVIVTDYHSCNIEYSDEIVINPNSFNCNYPFKKLGAAGVAFKLAETISSYYKMSYLNKYLDLVMIGTITKGLPIKEENLFFAQEGLKQLQCTNNYGIKALIEEHNTQYKDDFFSFHNIANIFPEMIPVEKISNARIIVELLTTSDSYRARQISKYLYSEVKRRTKI